MEEKNMFECDLEKNLSQKMKNNITDTDIIFISSML